MLSVIKQKKELLGKGMNYSITPTTIPAVDLVAKIETVLTGMPTEEADTIRADLSSIIRRTQAPKPNCTRNQIAALKFLQQNDNIIILPADKGRATVILNKEDYIRKCNQHLENGPYVKISEVSFFTWRGGLWKFFKLCKFLVINPYCMSKIFLIPPEILQNLSDPHLIIKAAELASVFEAEIDHLLGLLKMKARNLRGILIVVRAKLQKSHHINILYTTDKKFSRQLPFISSYFRGYGKQVTMATEGYFYISAV